ncbi:hypothetical protein [Bradyrhizobium sp. RDM4]|uniref:hypothetical protein n=1 Tax=Bradyrhizobium sp. RDM4 TaxID=3378765 RepID=UPI0038FCE6E7
MPRKANFKDLINGSVAACSGVSERQHPLQAGHGQASRHHPGRADDQLEAFVDSGEFHLPLHRKSFYVPAMPLASMTKPNPELNVPGTLGQLRRLHAAVRFALPQRHAIMLIIALVLTVACINAFEPLVLKWVFDQLTDLQMPGVILTGILLLLAFAVGREAMDGIANWLTWRTRIGLQYALLEATIGKLHRMPLGSSAVKASARS